MTHQIGTVTRDQGHSSSLLVRVDDPEQPYELLWLGGRPDFDPDRVSEACKGRAMKRGHTSLLARKLLTSEEPAKGDKSASARRRGRRIDVLDVGTVYCACTVSNPLCGDDEQSSQNRGLRRRSGTTNDEVSARNRSVSEAGESYWNELAYALVQ
jgi:hypothetical protein